MNINPNATPTELRVAGCNCEYTCGECGLLEYHDNECPVFSICPVARKPANGCPVHGTEEQGEDETR